MRSFTKKQLRITITLSEGKFGGTNSNTLIVEGLRASCTVQNLGAPNMGNASIYIWGMSQSDMNQMTIFSWSPYAYNKGNTILIEANNNYPNEKWSAVYFGDIFNAWADYRNAPDVFMYIDTISQNYNKLNELPVTSFPGAIKASKVMADLASKMGMDFEDNGVESILMDAYYHGTGIEQAKEIAKHYNFDCNYDNNTMLISPKGKPRKGTAPLLNKESGLVGYPSFSANGIVFTALYDPAIRFMGAVQIDGGVPVPGGDRNNPSIGTWMVYKLVTVLESEMPRGQWFNYGEGYPVQV
ncbi:MAG: hypothetical protein WC571_02175 [Candidatus Omnitrophota bacterium]